MFDHGKKMLQFYSNPKFQVGMNVWSKAIRVHTKMSMFGEGLQRSC
jgi:hypothetical protein